MFTPKPTAQRLPRL